MINFEITGLDDISRELERMIEDIPQSIENELLKFAEIIVTDAQLLCPDNELRESIYYELNSEGNDIGVSFFSADNAKKYLELSFDENKGNMPNYVAVALKKALKGR